MKKLPRLIIFLPHPMKFLPQPMNLPPTPIHYCLTSSENCVTPLRFLVEAEMSWGVTIFREGGKNFIRQGKNVTTLDNIIMRLVFHLGT